MLITKAELLSLSQTAKEAMFLTRLLKELHVSLPEAPITITCDNKQTIRLIKEDIAKLYT